MTAKLSSYDDSYEEDIVKQRGRIEKRTTEVYRNFITTDEGWEVIKEMIKVHRHREVFITKEKSWKASHETSYYVSTTSLSAEVYGKAIRAHWGIENRNHNVRDNAFQEDKSRIRKNPGKIARLRSWALNILRINGIENVSRELYENSLNLANIMGYKGIT